jgi:DNA replication licensing factor MCM4
MYGKDFDVKERNLISLEKLTRYISFARRVCHPELSDESGSLLVEAYVEMRKAGAGSKVITATPRQLESLIRLSEARARIRLSQVVDPEDVKEAIRLMQVATLSAATDPKTGKIDMNLITTGQGAVDRGMIDNIKEAVLEILESKKRLPLTLITNEINDKVADRSLEASMGVVREACEELRREGLLKLQAKSEVYFLAGQGR